MLPKTHGIFVTALNQRPLNPAPTSTGGRVGRPIPDQAPA